MKLHPRPLTCLLLFACAAGVLAQPNPSAFVKYTTDQGLSNDHVNDIVKDRQGFLWVATFDGLNRFDGHSFKQFFHDPEDPKTSLPNNFIKYLSLSPGGDIFISTNQGVCRLQPATLDFSPFELPEPVDTLEDNLFGKVIFDPEGKGWVSGETALHHFDPKTGKVVSYPIHLPHAGYFASFLDSEGRFWMVNMDKISYFDTRSKKLRHFVTNRPGHPLANAGIMHVQQDQRGTIWIGSWEKGLLKYDPALDSILDVPDKNSLARFILPDAASAGHPFLWISGGLHGLYIYYPETDEDFQFVPDRSDPGTHNHYLPHEDAPANLDFPDEAGETPFVYAGFGWNAHGHEPAQVYDKPHFDFHFYIQPEAEVLAITPADTVKGNTLPAPDYLPAGHIPTGLVPQMGNHIIDLASPELNGQPFTTTFIYGTFDGKVTFFEPMITEDFITEQKNFEAAIKLPNKYEHTGKFYPTRYGFRYDANKEQYQFYLKDFVQR